MKFIYFIINLIINVFTEIVVIEDSYDEVVLPIPIDDSINNIRLALESRRNRFKQEYIISPQISWEEFKKNNAIINRYLAGRIP